MSSTIHRGDCLHILPTFRANGFEAFLSDPPAAIGFMGEAWDGDRGGRSYWVAWLAEIMHEVLRVLKPGAHGLVLVRPVNGIAHFPEQQLCWLSSILHRLLVG